ncbi:hypothetical protein [Acidithiobacillus ferridurans]|uniref:Uncharacterized protein n=1 Tax=Acidithiobacillus ferridurans TaxID=1232575 RepID=A0A8X8GC23_ACIFI|nr:hypothetical protein [Acidithiobacillus ferridurans]MBU2715125.1 hypothetical protein [Acidithiobacillus ferridurans]MBU2724904.1 hypothetical protein [Acidithiobacillus ferridurans]MBU2728163.1 hypothetical protein [Acidithiobacillus ferridurans]
MNASELESLFGTDDAMGVVFDPCANYGEGGSVFGDGTNAITCTNYAWQVKRRLSTHAVQVVGFSNDDNPDCDAVREEWHMGGHDFAIVDHRFLVDTWVRLVECAREKIVYDLDQDGDIQEACKTYGNPKNWVEIDRDKGFTKFTDTSGGCDNMIQKFNLR